MPSFTPLLRILALTSGLGLGLAGCVPATLERAPPERPQAAPFAGQPLTDHRPSAALLGWQQLFGDPRLQGLIATALRQNRDLRIAMLQVDAARATHESERAQRLPALRGTLGPVHERSWTAQGGPARQAQWNAGIGISAHEVDLWGRARALDTAAQARELASDEGRRAAQTSLVAAVADAYFAERLADAQVALAQRGWRSWTDHLALMQRLQAAAQISASEVMAVEEQAVRARTEWTARQQDLQRASQALTLLVGQPAEALGLPAPLPLEQQPLRSHLPPGLPSDLLIHRPDIRQAEQALAAAQADVAAARAAFLPQITLTSTLGLASADLGGLFRGAHRVWSFVPTVSVPLFDHGRLKAELRLSELRQDVAVADYERLIQIALREVADGLDGMAHIDARLQSQHQVLALAERRAGLARQRHQAGLDSRRDRLEAERTRLSAQQELLLLRREALANMAGLYKALGGGTHRGEGPGS